MKNNETGEFELVLGNKQLLSGFFIVVILFAVFFVMGYIVGRNSTPAPQLAAGRDAANVAAAPPNTRPEPSGGSPAVQNPPAETSKEEGGGSQTPSATGRPGSQPVESRPASPYTPAPVPSASAPPSTTAIEPAPGETYLQVTAVKQDVAETVAKTLKDKGFPALLSPGPSGKVRVLVGPYADLSKLGQAKAELERLGFSPFVKK